MEGAFDESGVEGSGVEGSGELGVGEEEKVKEGVKVVGESSERDEQTAGWREGRERGNRV